MKQGHSNIYASDTKPYPTSPDKAMIPLIGGANVNTVKELPPLCLDKDEWEIIGKRMGWLGK